MAGAPAIPRGHDRAHWPQVQKPVQQGEIHRTQQSRNRRTAAPIQAIRRAQVKLVRRGLYHRLGQPSLAMLGGRLGEKLLSVAPQDEKHGSPAETAFAVPKDEPSVTKFSRRVSPLFQ